MARREKTEGAPSDKSVITASTDVDDFTSQLIKDINKEAGCRVAYNLAETEAPTTVKRWISTGSLQLNYAIKNAVGGGYPEGRVIEIAGPPSIGKSHLAYHAAAVVQSMGGLVIYVDSETATPIEKLRQMGIDIRRRFVYIDEHCTESIFTIIESVILKAKQLPASKNVPILVIWDSVAASSPKAELEGNYDKDTIGLQARAISKGMRKIVGVIGQNNVTLLCLNQLKTAIGVMYGDPDVTPGGRAIPFHASVRIRLSSGNQVKDAAGNVIGIHVIATIKKNKIAPPFRKYFFDIVFGKGIVEHEYVLDEVRSHCEKNKVLTDYTDAKGNVSKVELSITGTGAWKTFAVNDAATGEVLIEKKFTKNGFDEIMNDPAYKPFVDKIIDAAYVVKYDTDVEIVGETPVTDEEVTSE